MKKEIKVAIAAFLAIWIFIIGVEVGVLKEKKANAQLNATAPVVVTTETSTEPTTQTTTQPTTEMTTTLPATVITEPSSQQTVLPSADASVQNTEPSAPVAADPSSLTKEQVLDKVVAYMAQLKGEQNMTAVKKEDIKVQLTDLSLSAAKSIVQGVIDSLAGAEEKSYTFANGQAPDGEGTVTPNDVIPPTGRAFSLTAAGIVSGKAEKVGDNTVYTVVVAEEKTTLESPEPVHNAAAIGYLNLAGLDLPSALQLTKADMNYPGSTVVVTVDANDKVIGLKNEMPMTGVGEAKVLGATGSASFEGSLFEEWTFTY